MEKRYSSSEVQVCGDCHGDGHIGVYSTTPHTGERELSSAWICKLCHGAGMVTVKKETTVTITPHNTIKWPS